MIISCQNVSNHKNINERKYIMSHKHFTINKRNKLEVLLKENYKIARITEILEKDRTTIYREIKRVKGEYCAEKAQINAN